MAPKKRRRTNPIKREQADPGPIKPVSTGRQGRPSIYDDIRFPSIAYTLCAKYGFRNIDLAEAFRVDLKTIDKWIELHGRFAKAVRGGRDVFDTERVERALLERALGTEYDEVHRHYRKIKVTDQHGVDSIVPIVEKSVIRRKVLGDTGAQKMWLTNRSPERWPAGERIATDARQINEHRHLHLALPQTAVADLSALNVEQLKQLREIKQLTAPQQDASMSDHNELIEEAIVIGDGLELQEEEAV